MLNLLPLLVASLLYLLHLIAQLRSRSSQTQGPSKAPRVSSWIPWFGNAFEYSQDPRLFLYRQTQKFGPAFRTLIAGRLTTVVTGPFVSSVMRHPDVLGEEISLSFLWNLAGVNVDADTRKRLQVTTYQDIFPFLATTFNKTTLSTAAEIYSGILDRELRKTTTNGGPHRILLLQTVRRCLFFAAVHTLVGSGFPCEEIVDAFWEFEQGAAYLVQKIPFLSRPGRKGREKAVATILKFVQQCDKTYYDGTSDFSEHAIRAFKSSDIPDETIARMLLSFCFGLLANTVPATFWTLLFILEDPDLTAEVKTEVTKYVQEKWNGDAASIPAGVVQSSNTLPFLDSIITETLRITGTDSSLRIAMKSFSLKSSDVGVDPIAVEKGDILQASTMLAHYDPAMFPEPNKFRPNRFWTKEGGVVKSQTTKQPLSREVMAFGGGLGVCKGRYMAQFQIKSMLIQLFNQYDVSMLVSDVSGETDNPYTRPSFDFVAMGICRTKRDVPVSVTRRSENSNSKM